METLFTGPPVYTLCDQNPLAEALVVEHGMITAVGGSRELAAQFPGAKKITWRAGRSSPLSMTVTATSSPPGSL